MYKYHYRPGYGSTHLLIEIFSTNEKEFNLEDLFTAIAELKPQIIKAADVWMNDELLLDIDTEMGQFTLSKDIWDTVFLMAEDNQFCLNKIHSILVLNKNFEKVEVDFKKYILYNPLP